MATKTLIEQFAERPMSWHDGMRRAYIYQSTGHLPPPTDRELKVRSKN